MATRREGATEGGRVAATGVSQKARTGPSADGRRRGGPGHAAPDGADLRRELRGFVLEHPRGWGHDEWLQLLERLRVAGRDVHDPDAVGAMLERERLAVRLKGVKGIGEQRIRALSDRYGSVWALSQADPEDLTRSARIPRALVERIRSAD